MNYKKLNVNVAAVTFNGLSLSYQRKIAFFSTVLIWVAVSIVGLSAARHYGDSQPLIDTAIISFFGMIIHYILGGEFLLYKLARLLLSITPLAVLYRHDKEIIDQAKSELFRVAGDNKFDDFLHYARINPVIRSDVSLQVVAHQKRGDLREWTKNVRNLKKLANFIYQVHLAEQYLAAET